MFDFFFGGAKNPPSPNVKPALDMNNALSPFAFLASNLSADEIDLAHRTILSQLSNEKKRGVMTVFVGYGQKAHTEFIEWQIQMREHIPPYVLEFIDPEQREAVAELVRRQKFDDAINLARKSSLHAGNYLKGFAKKASDKADKFRFNLVFDNAAEILKQWREQKELEERPQNISPLSQRDEEFLDAVDTVETVSAKNNDNSWTIVEAAVIDQQTDRKVPDPDPQVDSSGRPPISALRSSNSFRAANSLSPPPLCLSDAFYAVQTNGEHEPCDSEEYFKRFEVKYNTDGVSTKSQEKPADSYAQAASKNTNTSDISRSSQQQASMVSSKPPAPDFSPVEKPQLFGNSARSAAYQNKENSVNRKCPGDLTDEEEWKARYNSEWAEFNCNPTGARNSYAAVASKLVVTTASITLNDNKNSSQLPMDALPSSYEKHFHEQLPMQDSSYLRPFTTTTDESRTISQGPIRRSIETENIPGRGDNENWIVQNDADSLREKLQSVRSFEDAVAHEGPRTRSMSRALRATSRSRSPLRTVPSSPRKRSKSPLKPPLPAALAPRKRSESPKFKATRQPKVEALNILLLGETGVGKTTFINGLANYLKFETLDGAMAGEPTILVDASFTVTKKNNKTTTIVAKANTGVDQETIKLNERLGDKGTSSTQEPVDHLFEWMSEGEKKLVRIIDTPGINDTRGPQQDAKNFDKILKHIAELGELHAVCIVMKPNESKFTVGFRYCLDELLVKLHRSVTKNIVFCFTNTRSTLYRPGDTLSTLHEYLKKVETETGVCIAANRSNIFCYDNDTFRYLCVLRQLPNALTETTGLSTKATFSDGWIHNVKESELMLKRVQGLIAHVVEDMMVIDRARKVVTALARPLGEIARNHVVNMKMIEDKIKEVDNLEKSGYSLDALISHEEVTMERMPLSAPRTVCSSPRCVEYLKVNEYEQYTNYITICHDPCRLPRVEENSANNNALRGCEVFNSKGSDCKKCGCPCANHMRISYELEYKMTKRVDQDTLNKWNLCSNKKQKAELVLSDLKEKLERLEREQDQIHDSCAEFSAFLSMNSLKQTCDPFAEYLRHLSDDENSKCENGGGNMEIAVAVCMMGDDYAKRVNFIKEEIKSGRRVALSTRQLNTMIANLSKLKLCGHIIAELMNEQPEVSEKVAENVPSSSKEEISKDLSKVSSKGKEENNDSKPCKKEKPKKNTNSNQTNRGKKRQGK